MTLLELINAYKVLQQMQDMTLPSKLAYGIYRNLQKMESRIKAFEKTRNKRMEAAETDEEKEKVQKELMELLDEEVKEDWYMVPVDAFPDTIEMKHMMAIGFMVQE